MHTTRTAKYRVLLQTDQKGSVTVMAHTTRLQTILRHIAPRSIPHLSSIVPCGSRVRWSNTGPVDPTVKACPELSIKPECCLSDERLDIQAKGLEPGQLVTLQAKVYTENGKYKFLSHARYRAAHDGTVHVQSDPSLGGSYEGVDPMGLVWGLKPAPEVAHKHPRLAKFDITKPFIYTFELLEGDNGHQDEVQQRVLASKVVERRFLADYVERIPVQMGEAEGVLFLPEKRGSSDPLPLVIDIRGLLTRLVVDRAAILASHGFAVFAFDYFLPRRLKSKELNVYMDSQAFLDIIEYAKEHPRLDADRIGMTSSCYGGSMMLHAVTRLQLPVKCVVAAGFTDVLSVTVGWKNPDGSVIEPFGPVDRYVKTQMENGQWWLSFDDDASISFSSVEVDDLITLVDDLKCPFLMFGHGDDQHIPSLASTLYLKERLEKAGKSHLVDFHLLPGTGHFLEVPFQPLNTTSSLFNPAGLHYDRKLYYTNYGGKDTKQGAKDQEFAWGRIINFFRKHLEVKEMYRKDWISD